MRKNIKRLKSVFLSRTTISLVQGLIPRRKVWDLFAFVITLPFILPHKADAYIDPNTGGFFFTSILPFVYGILAAIVIFWKRIANAVKNIFSRSKEGKS